MGSSSSLPEGRRARGSAFDYERQQQLGVTAHRYTPYMPLSGLASTPSTSTLIAMPNRFSLKPFEKGDESGGGAPEDALLAELTSDAHSTAPLLDLGTVALQRIVSQMKGLRYDVKAEEHFIKDAARQGGLKSYLNYLTRKNPQAI